MVSGQEQDADLDVDVGAYTVIRADTGLVDNFNLGFSGTDEGSYKGIIQKSVKYIYIMQTVRYGYTSLHKQSVPS